MNKPLRSYLPQLTGLRALAAYMVFFHHEVTSHAIKPFFEFFFGNLYVGFVIFFVLSGFLITYHHQDEVLLRWDWLKVYFRKRFARIYPNYFLVLALFYYANSQNSEIWQPTYLLLNITLLKGWSAPYIYSGVDTTWTLTLEETFYILAPLLFVLFNRGVSLLLLAVLSVALGFIVFYLGPNLGLTHVFADFYSMSMLSFFFFFLAFAFGIFSAQIYTGKKSSISSWLKKIPGKTYFGLALIILALSVLDLIKPFPYSDFSFSWIQAGTLHVLIPLATGLFILGLSWEKTLLSRILATPAFVLLGKSSYVFYLIHSGFIHNQVAYVISSLHLDEFYGVIMFVVINIISILIFKLYEEPLARWIRSGS